LDKEKHYTISADFGKTYSNENQTLIISFTVCNLQYVNCAGQYLKLLPEKTDQKNFNGDDKYYVMFGPDYCGPMNDRVHAIIRRNHTNIPMKSLVHTKRDNKTHLYTLILYSNYTFEIQIDDKSEKNGTMQEEWGFFLPKFV
jgi:calreticulin